MEKLPVRYIEVTAITRVTPRMARITFGGDDLADFGRTEPDQQVKLYFPKPGQSAPRLPEPSQDGDFMGWYQEFNAIPETEQPWTRSYTIRAHRQGSIDIDFVLHEDAGPATRWALAAKPGDVLGIFGPSPLFTRPTPLATSIHQSGSLLLAGDETAIPAISAILESLPEGSKALACIEIADAAEEQPFETAGDVTVRWLPRGDVAAGHSDLLVEAVRAAEFGPGPVFAWVAGEAGMVRTLRRHLVGERGVPKSSIEFTGHWRLKLTQDDAPTEEDLAEAQEQLAKDSVWDEAYRTGTAPWVIDEPQPAVVELERDGRISGKVLDPGCGAGENTIHLARLGYDVLGSDYSAPAIDQARARAAEYGVEARFEVADALNPADEPKYDTIVDSALFHIFGDEDRAKYVRSLHRICRPGAVVHVLALSDQGPGYGPQISDSVIRDAFGDGWVLEDLRLTEYKGPGVELPAWLARVRRR
ncbi:SIP domain-containing protein [Amycolatopsis nigrescens]|uniref:SIP domain-containing protein n=1 Tax=Amycolatopsis nigrescens TaxID=381445 RepID=UPI0003683694|nr:SIP domain-containing protein [Amycolatopsis nigrescens]